ncbi:calcium and integrin-binding family member 3-like [Eriocheir sinensis]|uniref:calcium and integrin-binding family member 3-like n=1 Tax=Eriocheir sinensis TaxID=95602 RepID=UPI0021C8349D|nr:calcium and integrin-binding family member 3-like [Eriocheir sinensis]
MGNKVAAFTEEQLTEYEACSFLTRNNILRAERLFRKVCGGKLPPQLSPSIASSLRASFSDLDTLPELKENPFRRRVCEVFGESPDGALTFEQFLEMFSVFSEYCPRDVKAAYAFRVYDFDGDGYLGESDLGETVRHLTHDLLSAEEYSTIVSKVLEEADVDCDGRVSQSEFVHVILKCPEFVPNFHIRI